MLSQKCKYAIRTILFLATENGEGKKKNIREISEALKIPTPYLGKILQDLVPRKIISSVKGPNGGFYLTENNLRLPVLKIIETIDGLEIFEACGLGLQSCSDKHPCPIHDDFKELRAGLKNMFSRNTVADLAAEINSKRLVLVNYL